MAWTAKITDKSLSEGRLTVTVELSDGVNKYGERFVVSNAQGPAWLKNAINEKIRILDQLSDYEQSLELGDIDLTPEPQLEPPKPSKEDSDRSEWLQNYQKLQRYEKLVDEKLMQSDATELTELQAKVKADFKPEYADLVE